MARYATTSDLPKRLTVQRINAFSAGDLVAQEACLEAGCDLVDSYAQVKYSVPLSPVPNIVRDITLILGAYNMASRLGGKGADDMRQEYEDAMQWLRDLARGVVTLAITPPPTAAASSVALFSSSPSRFTREKFGV